MAGEITRQVSNNRTPSHFIHRNGMTLMVMGMVMKQTMTQMEMVRYRLLRHGNQMDAVKKQEHLLETHPLIWIGVVLIPTMMAFKIQRTHVHGTLRFQAVHSAKTAQ